MAKPAPAAKEAPVVAPPVGSIIAWHPELFVWNELPIPTLPPEWVVCDGTMIDDPESPFNGRGTPMLNPGWRPNMTGDRYSGRFLRRGVQSGVQQDDATVQHWHFRSEASRESERVLHETAGGSAHAGGGGHNSNPVGNRTSYAFTGSVANPLPPPTDDEIRLASMSVVWIMRIK